MTQGRHHIPTFRTPDLPLGYAECVECGQRFTREQWVTSTCPGRAAETEPAGKTP